jgi:hypothetical protein
MPQSIHEVVTAAYTERVTPEVLIQRLTEREEEFVGAFHMAGSQFGMFPQIIAEVFAELKFGAPITEEQRAMVHNNFVVLMNQIAEQQQQPPGN